MKTALAFDIGGTKIYSTIINENGEIMSNKELLNNVNISSFGICKYFIIYSQILAKALTAFLGLIPWAQKLAM